MSFLYEFLAEHKISYERIDHPPVFTCEDAEKYMPEVGGADTKNLFLRDGKGKRHFIVSVPPEKRVNLKALGPLLNATGLGFASAERLKRYLDVEPGSVTLLGVINDRERQVEVIVDADLWEADIIVCHPLVNTASLAIPRIELERFFKLCGHEIKILVVPELQE